MRYLVYLLITVVSIVIATIIVKAVCFMCWLYIVNRRSKIFKEVETELNEYDTLGKELLESNAIKKMSSRGLGGKIIGSTKEFIRNKECVKEAITNIIAYGIVSSHGNVEECLDYLRVTDKLISKGEKIRREAVKKMPLVIRIVANSLMEVPVEAIPFGEYGEYAYRCIPRYDVVYNGRVLKVIELGSEMFNEIKSSVIERVEDIKTGNINSNVIRLE